jgi:hypothetical protein
MRTGRPIAPLSLAVEERETLEGWARRPTTAQALAQARGLFWPARGAVQIPALRTSLE